MDCPTTACRPSYQYCCRVLRLKAHSRSLLFHNLSFGLRDLVVPEMMKNDICVWFNSEEPSKHKIATLLVAYFCEATSGFTKLLKP